METSLLKKLGKGEFFKLRETETAPVWFCSYYDPSCRKYMVQKFDDINHTKWMNGNKVVFTGFYF